MTASRDARGQWLRAFALLTGACGFSPAWADLPSSNASSQVESPRAKILAEKCAHLACRTESRELRFQTSDGTAVMQTELLPYADEGAVILYPGEAIEVDFAADGKSMDKPHFSRTVDHLDDPKSAALRKLSPTAPRSDSRANFWFEFQQVSTGMMLKLKSDMGYSVKYRAIMLVPEKEGLMPSETSSCPVIPYGFAFESWPHAIAMMALSDFRLVPDGTATCE